MSSAALRVCARAAIAARILPFALLHAAKKGHLRVVEALLEVGDSPNDLQLALHLAAADDHARAIKLLLGHGANANARYPAGGMTPLHDASRTGAVTSIEALLSAGAKVNATDGDGATPLHWAARNDQGEAIRVLLAAGADPLASTSDGTYALRCATKGGAAAAVLEGATTEAMSKAFDDVRRAGELIEKGMSELSASALLDAGTQRDGGLVTQAHDPKAEELRRAAEIGDIAAIEALVAAGANVGAKDTHGNTSLHVAAENGHVAATEVLLAAGADARAKNNLGKTPLHLAVANGHAATIAALERAAR